MKYVDIIPNSQEWIEYRKTRIGASDTPVIMGVSPFKTPNQLWESKLYGTPEQINPAMKRGIERERQGLDEAEKRFNVHLQSKVIEHPEFPWKFCSADGIDILGEVLVEVKWANKKVHDLAKRGIVIDYYYPQCQAQLACTGLNSMWFLSCYDTGFDSEFEFVKVMRDNLFIEKMIEMEDKFYQNHMVKNSPPELCDRDYERLDQDQSYIFDLTCQEYFEILEKEKMLDGRKKEILERLKGQCNQKNTLTNAFKATKFRVSGSIDYKSIPELNNVNLEAYRKESREQWKISKV